VRPQLFVPGVEPRDFQLRGAAAVVGGRDVFVVYKAGSGKTLAATLAACELGG